MYCVNGPESNGDVAKIITCKDNESKVYQECLATVSCIDDPSPHCALKSQPEIPSLVTPMPILIITPSPTSSDTILPTPPGFPKVPSTADDPLTSSTDTTRLAARQTQAPFRLLIYPQTSIRGKGTSFDADRCIADAEIPWPIRSLVVERYFQCMFWDTDDCSGRAGPQRVEGSSKDRKIIRDVKFGFGIKSTMCLAVPG